MVLLQLGKGLLQRAGHLRHVLELLRTEAVDVLVEGVAGIDRALDPVEPRHQHGGEGEIGIAGRIGRAELGPLRLRTRRIGRDADRGGAIARRVGQVDGRLEAGNQPLVAVGSRVANRRQRARVLEQAADVVQAGPG